MPAAPGLRQPCEGVALVQVLICGFRSAEEAVARRLTWAAAAGAAEEAPRCEWGTVIPLCSVATSSAGVVAFPLVGRVTATVSQLRLLINTEDLAALLI